MTRRTPAQYNWTKLEFDETLLTQHFTVQSSKIVKYVVVHHMTIVGNGSGSALDACYKTWQTRQASAHYGVDGTLVRQFVWDKDYAWATGSTDGNRYGISIEHANSAAGPKWTVAETTWKTGAKLAAHLHKTYKLGRPVKDKTLRKHSSFYATACPGPYVDSIWAKYVAEAQRVYDTITNAWPVAVRPDAGPAAWFKIETWNLGGMNDTGRARWAATEQAKVDDIAEVNADVVCVQELAGAYVKTFSARMAKAGYVRVCGSDGRYIFRKTSVGEGKSGVFNLTPIYAGDDKQAAWAELWPSGPNSVFITNGHLEFRDGAAADAIRVKQALSQLNQGNTQAACLDIPVSRRFFAADTNSEGMVRDALKAAGYVDMFAVTDRQHYSATATFTGWDTAPFVGPRIDLIAVYKGRPVVDAGVRRKNAGLSDHLASVCIVGKI